MRQFAIVWLVSPAACGIECITTPRGPIPRSSSRSPGTFGTAWGLLNLGQNQPIRLSLTTTCLSQLVFQSGHYFLLKQETSVYRHSGPLIHKLAVLIQLRGSSWTIQKWKQCEFCKWRAGRCVSSPTRGGSQTRWWVTLYHSCQRWSDDWSLSGDATPSVCVRSSVRSVPWKPLVCTHSGGLGWSISVPKLGTDCQKCSLPVHVTLRELRG